MQSLIQIFWDICLLRRGPQVLPYSLALLGLVLFLQTLLGILFIAITKFSLDNIIISILNTGFMVLLYTAVLLLFSHIDRLVQTLTAVAGCDVLLGLIGLPLIILGVWFGQDSEILAMFWLILLLWNILVAAHILRHALVIPLIAGMGMSIALTALAIYINTLLKQAF